MACLVRTCLLCRAKELGKPDAVYQIVHDLAHLADKPDFRFGPAAVAKLGSKKQGPGTATGAVAASAASVVKA